MKKLLFIIFLMVFSFATIANAKKPKEKVSWPKAVLTLNDGTVLNGYLRIDIHDTGNYILFSETEDGKKTKYKNETIKSLFVKDCLGEGKDVTLLPVKFYFREGKQILKNPVLAIQVFQGKHVKGYMRPTVFDHTTTNRSFSGIVSTFSVEEKGCWDYLYNVDSDNTINMPYWFYRPGKDKPRNLKSNFNALKKTFEKYPQLLEIIEKQGITAEQISDDPIMLLEILDKTLQ